MPSTETPDVAAAHGAVGVVIVSWNVRDLLLSCVESLAGSRRPLRIVVVDNASSDGSVAALALKHPSVEVIANGSNLGFTRATNQGLRHLHSGALATTSEPVLECRTVLLLNPDTEAVGDAIGVLTDYLDAHPKAGTAGPALISPDGTPQSSRRRFPTLATGLFEGTPFAWHWPGNPAVRRYTMASVPESAGPVDWVTGAALAVKTEALREIGGLDEGFFMYSEELDLCRRLHDAGWETHFVPSAKVVHHEGKSSEQAVLARHLHFQRSRVRYFRKYHGRLQAAVVRAAVLLGYALEAMVESVKLAVGHRAPLRRQRLATYRAILADGLAPEAPEASNRATGLGS